MRRLVTRMHRWFGRRGGPYNPDVYRIATPEVDPWGLSVSLEHFAEQVQALCVRRTILSMDAFVSRLQSGVLPHDAVALTFDDGYLDNLSRPSQSWRLPAFLPPFLTTGQIGTDEEFVG